MTDSTAFGLFLVDRDGLFQLDVAGATAASSGRYSLTVSVVGDVNGDLKVDGLDAQLLSTAFGKVAGQPGFLAAADSDRDGVITTADVQNLASNLGFAANLPPGIEPRPILTHVDLATTFDLASMASDPEDDPVYFRIVASEHGVASLAADGHTVTFTPSAGYSGPANFQVVADDGWGYSPTRTIQVNVSAAPLVGLSLRVRNPRLEVGGSARLELVGDFTDQSGVALPASYATFASLNPGVASVSAEGRVVAVSNGASILLITSRGLQTVTAVAVGLPTETLAQQLQILGLDNYPDAVSLVVGGTRQLVVSLQLETDLTPASAGTRYFVSNSGVVEVSADGRITAKAEGEAEVTVVNGAAEAVTKVRVVKAQAGPVTLDGKGGVVRATDGAMLQVAPDSFLVPVPVQLIPVAASALPMAVPSFINYLSAYQIETGGQDLAQPAQLAVPVPSSLAPGTKVYFYRAGSLPDEQGIERSTWLEVEIGVVGNDGYARTTSPPLPGITGQQLILVGYATILLGTLFLAATYLSPVGLLLGTSIGVSLVGLGVGSVIAGAGIIAIDMVPGRGRLQVPGHPQGGRPHGE